MQSIPSAVPAAESVDMHHNRNNNGEEEEEGSVVVEMKKMSAPSPPSSPKSFNSDEIFEDIDVEYGDEGSSERISDHDLDRLLGPLPTQNNRRSGNSNTHSSLETDTYNNENESDSDNDSRNRRRKIGSKKIKGFCPCCPQSIRQGPCHLLASVIGRDGPVPIVGHMIVVLPKCYYSWGFGIMGPHWFGPICCFFLLTFATIYFTPKAYHIGPISSLLCLVFYIVAVISLCIVSCSDPGVVRSDGAGGGGKNGYAGVTQSEVSAGRGWRYCDLCSVYQPPDAVHCPECNVCIEGYDHHCPWMGTCIGKRNFSSFMTFNLTWLFYFLYAIIWVTFIGASFYEPHPGANSSSDDF